MRRDLGFVHLINHLYENAPGFLMHFSPSHFVVRFKEKVLFVQLTLFGVEKLCFFIFYFLYVDEQFEFVSS